MEKAYNDFLVNILLMSLNFDLVQLTYSKRMVHFLVTSDGLYGG